MRVMILVLLAGATMASAAPASNSATVITATATSSAPSAAPVSCLLKPECAGSWSPGSADSGANEGVYVQFESPVAADTAELVTNLKEADAPFILSINGAPAPRSAPHATPTAGRYPAQYAIPGGLVKSVFFRLGLRKGGWKGFSLYSIRFYRQQKPVEPALPVLVPASVTATSVLEPTVAYQPANLFDSRYDFAWSTNGKTSKGKGESVEIRFSQPQNLSGVMIWNGYQRSEQHFKANGRVARLSLSNGQVSNSLRLGDQMGGQRITLISPLKDVTSVKLTIDEIIPGTKYPDVLLSELRFIDDHNQILVPQVSGMAPLASPLTEAVLDRSLSSVVCYSSTDEGNFQRSLRLRRDGSFVIYGKSYHVLYEKEGYPDEPESNVAVGHEKSDQVLEGNWQLQGSAVRIFGKRYAELVMRDQYSQTARKVPASIFQSDLTIARFHDLMPDDKQKLATLILTRIGAFGGYQGRQGEVAENIYGVGDRLLAEGSHKETVTPEAKEKILVTNLVKSLEKMNPWTVSSPILADAMLPSDDVGPCGTHE